MEDLQPWEQTDFYDAYNEGSLIEESFRLLSMADIASEPSVIGASRFFFLPAHGKESVITLFYEDDLLSADMAVSPVSFWHSAVADRNDFDSKKVVTAGRSFGPTSIDAVPSVLRSFDSLLEAARKAQSCATATMDGESYRHTGSCGRTVSWTRTTTTLTSTSTWSRQRWWWRTRCWLMGSHPGMSPIDDTEEQIR